MTRYKIELTGAQKHIQSCPARMLRISLCQPPNDVATISTRLDCVDELLENENMYHSIRACLPAFGALDKLIANLVKLPRFAENSRNMSQEINSIVRTNKHTSCNHAGSRNA